MRAVTKAFVYPHPPCAGAARAGVEELPWLPFEGFSRYEDSRGATYEMLRLMDQVASATSVRYAVSNGALHVVSLSRLELIDVVPTLGLYDCA